MEPPVLTRWRHQVTPSDDRLAEALEHAGLVPRWWEAAPGEAFPAHAHGYDKVLFCGAGGITFVLQPTGERLNLAPGDRLDLPAGWDHSARAGPNGARCVEGWVGSEIAAVARGC